MNINFAKIAEIYGEDIIFMLTKHADAVNENIEYLMSLGFNAIEDIFERNVPIFICSEKEFKNKVDNLIHRIGDDYLNILEEKINLWEDLL